MTTPTLGDAFSAELMPGETIEWTGQPNSAAFFHREDERCDTIESDHEARLWRSNEAASMAPL